jgi:hypothetical protein
LALRFLRTQFVHEPLAVVVDIAMSIAAMIFITEEHNDF